MVNDYMRIPLKDVILDFSDEEFADWLKWFANERIKRTSKGTVLFACPHENDSDTELAKQYCREKNLTHDQVSIKIRYAEKEDEKNVVVVVKK